MNTQATPRGGRFVELSEQECWELLAAKRVGRVALCTPGGPRVFPVNYAIDGKSVYFKTAPYTQLATEIVNGRAAFQIDEADEFLQAGWSVLVIGQATRLDDPDDVPGHWWHGPEPWAEGNRTLVVRIDPIEITGRRVLPT